MHHVRLGLVALFRLLSTSSSLLVSSDHCFFFNLVPHFESYNSCLTNYVYIQFVSRQAFVNMGRWGELLFEGDIDLDTASEISHDAGTELLHYEVNAEDPEFGGKGLEATREHLNNGALKRLFNEYSAKDFSKDYFVGKELRLVFLGNSSSITSW